MADNKIDLGNIFVKSGGITKLQLKKALNVQKETGKRLEQVLQDEGVVSEDTVKELLKYRFNIVSVCLNGQNIQEDVPTLISGKLARKYTLIPFKKSNLKLLVAMADPYNFEAIDEVQMVTGLTVLPRKAEEQEILEMIECFYEPDVPEEVPQEVSQEGPVEQMVKMPEVPEPAAQEETPAAEPVKAVNEEVPVEEPEILPEELPEIAEPQEEIEIVEQTEPEEIPELEEIPTVAEEQPGPEEKVQPETAEDEKNKKGSKKIRLGFLLVQAGIIHEEQLAAALEIQKKTGKRLGEILVDNGLIKEEELTTFLSQLLGFPSVKLNNLFINPEIPALVKESLARKYLVLPLKIEKGQLLVAMADPLNVYAIDDIRLTTGFNVSPYIAGKREILKAIEQYYGQQSTEEAAVELLKEMDTEDSKELDKEALLTEVNNAPLVRLVNSLLRQAVAMKASDIHIEPFEKNVRVRFRLDGDLQEIMTLEINTHPAVVARIKIMGKMDIAEKRVPQDGRVEIKVEDRRVDLRLSTLPTTYGEKVVIRILDRDGSYLDRRKLGFSKENMERMDSIIKHPYGIILVTGPTGSGKTSTLYTILGELNKINCNIITVEDPIEFRMAGINQVQVNHKAGLTFASGLRSILRQDPDIVMIGEIRDSETVEIAVRAAITGHLVLSTIHTNDTASTITRLVDMGVEPYLISSSLVGIMAQRLVKKICPDCRSEYQPDEMERKLLDIEEGIPIYRGKGCSSCNNTGYKGRTVIAEIMEINLQMKKIIDERKSSDVLKAAAVEQGMITLQHSCKELVLKGITTMEEFIRNTYVLD